MTTEEMFEKLGYTKTIEDSNYKQYEQTDEFGMKFIIGISNSVKKSMKMEDYHISPMTFAEIKAVAKAVEEMENEE